MMIMMLVSDEARGKEAAAHEVENPHRYSCKEREVNQSRPVCHDAVTILSEACRSLACEEAKDTAMVSTSKMSDWNAG